MTCTVLTLQLIKGVPSPYSLGAPSTDPYDPQPLVIDFLTGVWRVKDASGVAAYDPGIAGLKNGGVNVDSPLLDNILPIAAPVGVVTDGLTITSSSDKSSKTTALSEIMDVLRSASSFFFDTVYNEPVYLKVQLAGDAGPRYALIYDFTSDDVGDMLANEPHEIVFTLVREAYWRWLAPGANPKLYAFGARGLEPGVDYDYQDLSLGAPTSGDTAPYFVQAITNSCRFSGTNILATERNYIDIDAEDVPGDAPALLEVKVTQNGSYSTQNAWIARKTRQNMDSGSVLATMNHNGADAEIVGAGPTNVTRAYNTDATNGILSDPPDGTVQGRYTLRVTYATGAITDNQRIARWDRPLNKNLGRVRCLVRARLNSGTVTNAQFQIGLGYPSLLSGIGVLYHEIDEGPVFDLSSNPTPSNVAIYDAGSFDLSFLGNPPMDVGGVGSQEAGYTLALKTVGRGVVGSNTVVDIIDIILLPYDEYAVQIPSGGLSALSFYSDTTGYFNRGLALPRAGAADLGILVPLSVFTGSAPLLEPNKDARIYVLLGNINDISTPGGTAALAGSISLTANIIPRSRHLRDRV